MAGTLSERLEACAEEMESRLVIPRVHELLREAAELARRVEGAAVLEFPSRRGPAFDGATLQISTRAAERLGLAGKRVALVEVGDV